LAAGLRGYGLGLLSGWRRVAAAVGGLAMIYPDLIVSLAGLLLALVGLLLGAQPGRRMTAQIGN
jgi:hypothetical protein